MRLITLVTLFAVLISACSGVDQGRSPEATEITLPEEETQFVQARDDTNIFGSQAESEPTDAPTDTPDADDDKDTVAEPTEVITAEPTQVQTISNEPCDYRDGWVVYEIRGGDTLWELSQLTGTTVQALQEANCHYSDVLTVGKRFVVPRLPDADDN